MLVMTKYLFIVNEVALAVSETEEEKNYVIT